MTVLFKQNSIRDAFKTIIEKFLLRLPLFIARLRIVACIYKWGQRKRIGYILEQIPECFRRLPNRRKNNSDRSQWVVRSFQDSCENKNKLI